MLLSVFGKVDWRLQSRSRQRRRRRRWRRRRPSRHPPVAKKSLEWERQRKRESLSVGLILLLSLSLSLSLTFTHTCFLSLSLSRHKGRKSSKCDSNFFPLLLPPHRTRVLRRLRGCPRSLRGHIGLWRGRRPLKQPSKSSQLSRATFLVKARLFVQQLWKISSTSFIKDWTSHSLLASNLNEDLFL